SGKCIFMYLSAVLLSGCASTPKWIENPKAVYPEQKFLVAVGEGDTRRSAENAAAANLSRIFEARIESEERLQDRTHETRNSFERTSDFTTDINILSAQTLHNIQHAEAWKDKNGRYHAIAYLNRRETAAIYRDKIDRQSERVSFLLSNLRQTADPLRKFATLRAAIHHAEKADILIRQLKIIQSRSVPELEYSMVKLHSELADTAKKIKVEIHVEGDIDQRIGSCMEELITRYGFVTGQPGTIKIKTRISIHETDQSTADLVFVRYDLSAQVLDTEGSVLVSINEKGREGHVTIPEARIRSIRTLENAIKAKVIQQFDRYFGSLVEQQ
ncbi:MAG TPA: LPP20 family lipoprotein, partial [Pontiella sp.]